MLFLLHIIPPGAYELPPQRFDKGSSYLIFSFLAEVLGPSGSGLHPSPEPQLPPHYTYCKTQYQIKTIKVVLLQNWGLQKEEATRLCNNAGLTLYFKKLFYRWQDVI